jgi:hypothetical protein
MHRYTARQALGVAMLVLLTTAGSSYAAPVRQSQRNAVEVAQAGDSPRRDLEPRYQPVPPAEKGWYNDSYIFAATRGVANSTMVPVAKVSLYVLTIPFDLVLLPIAAIGGLFG